MMLALSNLGIIGAMWNAFVSLWRINIQIDSIICSSVFRHMAFCNYDNRWAGRTVINFGHWNIVIAMWGTNRRHKTINWINDDFTSLEFCDIYFRVSSLRFSGIYIGVNSMRANKVDVGMMHFWLICSTYWLHADMSGNGLSVRAGNSWPDVKCR